VPSQPSKAGQPELKHRGQALRTPAATIAFVLFGIFSIVWFLTKPAQRAAALTLLVGVLYLPEATRFKIPLLPLLDKTTFPTFLVLFLNLVLGKRLFAKVRVGKVNAWLIAVLLLSNIPRVLGNLDPIHREDELVPGLLAQTSFTFMVFDVLAYLTMLYVGMALAQRRDWLIGFLKTWIGFAVVYCGLVLYEARFSPQLHTKVYGYFQHSWEQMMRDSGYRPIVFLPHALGVGLYLSVTAILLFGLDAEKIKVFGRSTKLFGWLVAISLVITKCAASLLYFVASAGMLILKSPKLQVRVPVLCAVLVLSMPALRAAQLFPWETAVALAEQYVSEDRASSLLFRFTHEEVVIQNTLDRPWFGMGGNSRAFGPDTVVDSEWIIVFMDRGFVGYLAVFGLLAWPLLNLPKAVRRATSVRDRKLLATLGLAAAMSTIDLMTNGLFTKFAFLLAGMVWGAANSAWLKDPAAAEVSGRAAAPPAAMPGMYPALPR
jgi:hypothetical protein